MLIKKILVGVIPCKDMTGIIRNGKDLAHSEIIAVISKRNKIRKGVVEIIQTELKSGLVLSFKT